MVTAYFDCFSGIAGDMILGAFIDLGMDIAFLKKEIKKLNLKGYHIVSKNIKKHNYNAIDVTITIQEKQPYRTYKDIKTIIHKSNLNDNVKKLSNAIFYKLATAEGIVHQVDVDQVHFHEVGAVDSIIDIVGSAIAFDYFNINDVFCSALPLGSGYVYCEHGKIPVPAPATNVLLKNIPTYKLDSGHEMITPTGAAVLTTICEKFDEFPVFKTKKKMGYGSGKIESSQPGVLRVIIGEKK